jgi:hypothetical protein
MAIQSVMKDRQGPDWPLGLIVVATPGSPVSIMSLVDPLLVNDPGAPTSATSDEYTAVAQQIIFQGYKAGAAHGLANNTGNLYVVRKGVQGNGSVYGADYGVLVLTVGAGLTQVLQTSAMVKNGFSPYRYFVDADNAGDSCLVTLLVQ